MLKPDPKSENSVGEKSRLPDQAMDKFITDFPRLYDLYLRSDRSDPQNFFTVWAARVHTPEMETLARNAFHPLERTLERLSPEAWGKLANKALQYVTQRCPHRNWGQLFDHLNEACGYALLTDRGYSDIQFIDTGDGKSPDLLGRVPSSTAIVEVKSINCSDDELKRGVTWPPRFCRPACGLPDGLMNKLRSEINDAREQLEAFCGLVDKRIALLIISFDTDRMFVAENYAELEEFILRQQRPDLEIVHQVKELESDPANVTIKHWRPGRKHHGT